MIFWDQGSSLTTGVKNKLLYKTTAMTNNMINFFIILYQYTAINSPPFPSHSPKQQQ